jgi:predicted small secreted protein
MKKHIDKVLLITIGLLVLTVTLLSSCTTTKGYNYGNHHHKSQQFAQKAGCWNKH